MNELLHDLLFDYTVRTVAIGAAVLGITAGALGCFAMLRRQSLLGDAIAHASLAGVTGAYLLTQSKSPLALLTGAAIAGWAGTRLMQLISRRTQLKTDAALGIVLSTFFGLGMMLLTYIQHQQSSSQSGLDKFLFGNASTLLASDVTVMALVATVSLLTLGLLWKGFKVHTFDPLFAASIGQPTGWLDAIISTLIVVAIVLGLQTVGVVLMSAMLVAPAAAARQWTDRLGRMVVLAAAFGAVSGVAGALISARVDNLPTGPTIVLIVSGIVVISLLFAPNRGLLPAWFAAQRRRRDLEADTVLSGMHRLAEAHADPYHPHSAAALRALTGVSAERALGKLLGRGLVRNTAGDRWALTASGLTAAREQHDGDGGNGH
jgi:manganese/zinc/iron transport system permease protein